MKKKYQKSENQRLKEELSKLKIENIKLSDKLDNSLLLLKTVQEFDKLN